MSYNLNSFLQTDLIKCLCSRQHFEKHCGIISNFSSSHNEFFPYFLTKCFQSCLLQICCMWLTPFPCTYNKSSADDFENIPPKKWKLMKVLLMHRVENMVTKGEITCFEQFLLLLPCFQKAVCYRGIRKRLYEGKG